jgi:DNA-binding PadR family transcriptional regulator
VTLGRMEEKGYLTSRAVDPPPGSGGMPRRLYELTALGSHAVKAARDWHKAAKRLTPAVAR